MTESDYGSAFVRRWQLAAALKELREKAGLTQEQAVAALRPGGGRWSESKLSRVENHEHGVRPPEVEQMLDAYGVRDEQTRKHLLTVAEQARDRRFRTSFAVDLPNATLTLASIEAGALEIRQFEPLLIPGLLQTTDYTRTLVTTIGRGGVPAMEVERRVAARMARQHVLRRPDPPRFHVILDEGILRRRVGRPPVLREQLRTLVDIAERPGMTLQIMPFDTDENPGLGSPFTLFSLPAPAPDMLYAEGQVSGMIFSSDRDRTRRATLRFGMMGQAALPHTESVEMIEKAVRDLD